MNNFNTVTNGYDEWITPKWITDAIGPFDLDPCSPGDRRPWDTAEYHLDKTQDGLACPWFGRVWCNPPYGKETFKWINKLADYGNGIALIFARTETKGFHREIFKRADGIMFFEGRLKFCYVTGEEADTSNAPSCLVAYGENNLNIIKTSLVTGKLKGELVILRKPLCLNVM